ncbi:DEAD/DEAH box helicase [Halodesulfovibrio spirochaetisodalis]|uniref:DEAD/DEAH box helicase n=1 Tax=Halodesulfovibrio spirochaetisodalis TaxID=1560234 RepID=A0A1B7XMM4_9BACT|nr:DEAD/DEAH box helicase [Halodesulfovibrio spirochaetisodalis]OBQ56756.1 hypothetical protein SP90_01330 [Halodesulfovibrio spirochaetisodalis]
MILSELQQWILSKEGLKEDIDSLCGYAASKEFQNLTPTEELEGYLPDWQRLLFAGSLLTASDSSKANEIALRIALPAILHSEDTKVIDAGASILTQLSNHRSVKLAVDKNFLLDGIKERVGVLARLLLERRELEQLVTPASGTSIMASRFQRTFWDRLNSASWVSASAPTASGKTYLVLQWLLNEFHMGKARLAVFIAPTRALVGEIERELIEMSASFGLKDLRVASLPLAALGNRCKPTILVFTQERLHVFLNYVKDNPQIDITIIDEAHKIGDRQRGVLLQDAIERLHTQTNCNKLIFLSPLTENPEVFVQGSSDQNNAIIPNETFTVVQNLIVAQQAPRTPANWELHLVRNEELLKIGNIELHARPDTQIKRLSYLALALGDESSGTLVYTNGAAEAEKVAQQIFDGLADTPQENEELKELSDFIKKTIHRRFLLASLVLKGVAFHYGNMPTLLRSELERLFRQGAIKFLVCTSTLVEGVNLACKTIVVRGPRKGSGNPMKPHDFWNLAGRAGRWGQDFSGNIVCIDVNRPQLWPDGVPKRSKYPVQRETDSVLHDQEKMLGYLQNRGSMKPSELDPQLEQVTAYAMSWQAREGTFLDSPSAKRLPEPYANSLDRTIKALFEHVDLPNELIARHPGVSSLSLQGLLDYFRTRNKPTEELLPSTPDSDDAYTNLIQIFYRINKSAYRAFYPPQAIPIFALITIEWMRGYPLGTIISNRIKYLRDRGKEVRLPQVIRNTMRDVEEVARFKAPKYLSAYMDVLRFYLQESGQEHLITEDIKFDVYLEFGVGTETLLSFIGLGLSRTSAVSLNDFLADDKMGEDDVFSWLQERHWESFDIPALVQREVSELLKRKERLAS